MASILFYELMALPLVYDLQLQDRAFHLFFAISPFECVYGNMPRFGLARDATLPAVGTRETASLRLGGQSARAVPSPDTAPID